jgi:hypothetical protein
MLGAAVLLCECHQEGYTQHSPLRPIDLPEAPRRLRLRRKGRRVVRTRNGTCRKNLHKSFFLLRQPWLAKVHERLCQPMKTVLRSFCWNACDWLQKLKPQGHTDWASATHKQVPELHEAVYAARAPSPVTLACSELRRRHLPDQEARCTAAAGALVKALGAGIAIDRLRRVAASWRRSRPWGHRRTR